ncbi:LPXTG cell wall anchor domain-containing protein [Lactococcus cremoris]
MNSKKMKKWVIYGVIALTILGPQTLIHENIHADESTTTIENGNEQAKKGTIEISIIDSSSGQVLKSFDITDFSNVQLQVHESEIESQIASLKGYILDPSQGSYAPNFIGRETAEAKFYVKRATSGTINVNIIDSSSGQVLKSFDITDVPGHLLESHESEIETQIASLKGYVLDKSQGSYAPTFIGGETGEAKFYVKRATSGTINVNIIDFSSGQVLKNFDITDVPGHFLESHESEIETQIASLKGYVLDKSQGSYAPTFIGGETGEAKFYVKRATSGTINVNIIDSSSGQVLKSFDITDVPGHLLESHESEIETQIASLKGYVLDKSQGSYAPTFIGGETGEAKFYVKKDTDGISKINTTDASNAQVPKNSDAKVLNHSSELTESQAQKKSSIDKDIKSQKIIAIEKKSKSLPHTGESSSILSYSLGSLALLGASFFFMIKRFNNL